MKKTLFLIFFLFSSLSFAQEYSDLKNLYPEANKFIKEYSPFEHFNCYKKGRLLGACFLASSVIPNTQGFSGKIETLICIDKKAKIKGIKILHHTETPQYAAKITSPSFLNQFKGKSIYDDFLVGKDIDGITSATISSKSVARIVRESCRIAYEKIFNPSQKFLKLRSRNEYNFSLLARKPQPKGLRGSTERLGNFKNISFLAQSDFILIISLALVFLFIFKRSVFLRNIFLLFVVFYFGFYKGLFISIFNFIQIIQFKLPNFKESISWYILLGASLPGALLLGRFYCGWLCPFGALQEIVLKPPFKKIKISFALNKLLLKVKYLLLIISIFVFLLFENDLFFRLEPFLYFFKPNFFNLLFYYSLFILIISLFIPRFYCRYLCLVGAIFAILSKISLVKYKISCKEKKCEICLENCPVGVIDKEKKITDYECIRCNHCQKCRLENKKGPK